MVDGNSSGIICWPALTCADGAVIAADGSYAGQLTRVVGASPATQAGYILTPSPDTKCTDSSAYRDLGDYCALSTDESKHDPACAALCSPYVLRVDDFDLVLAQMKAVADAAVAKIAENANRLRLGWLANINPNAPTPTPTPTLPLPLPPNLSPTTPTPSLTEPTPNPNPNTPTPTPTQTPTQTLTLTLTRMDEREQAEAAVQIYATAAADTATAALGLSGVARRVSIHSNVAPDGSSRHLKSYPMGPAARNLALRRLLRP